MWSETYDRPITDLFDIQDSVSAAIAGQLKVRLMPPSRRPTDSIEAYTLFLRARAMLNLENADFADVLALLDRALEIDDQFAEVHELKAYGYWFTVASPEVELAVHAAANAALAIDPSLVGARALATISHPTDWSWSIEFGAIEAAVAAKENDFNLVGALCYDLLMTGYRVESLRCARRMIELEPLSPVAHWREGLALSALGRFEEARDSYKRSIAAGDPYLWRFVAISHLVAGEFETALAAVQSMPTLYAWSPEEVRELIQNVPDSRHGTEYLASWVTDAANRATEFWAANLAYEWLLIFGRLDEYWGVIEGYAEETESAWTKADVLEILGTAFPVTGYTAHPKYIEYGSRWGLTELWDKRGKPDMCDKIDGDWVCN